MSTIPTMMRVAAWVLGMLVPVASLQAADRSMQPDVYLASALGKQPDETRGQKLFQRHCQRCHQVGAGGLAAQKIPSLAGQQYEYLVKQIIDFLDRERDNDTMHAQLVNSGVNNATSIADVVGYVSNLPLNPSPEQGPGTLQVKGKEIYQGFCASCHGRTAEGNADLWVPNLRGQHYSYMVEQMQRMARATRGNISEDLHRMFATYADEEFRAVADYLTHWQGE